MPVVLQGIHKVCERMACWSSYLLKHNSGIFCKRTLFYDIFTSDQIYICCFRLKLLQLKQLCRASVKPTNTFNSVTALQVYFTLLYMELHI